MGQMLIFGLGYTAQRITAKLRSGGWAVDTTGSAGNVDFADESAVFAALERATHVLSSAPPGEADPVLARHDQALRSSDKWLGYLSSTGVYGDTRGAYVDETAPTGGGRRTARSDADAGWLNLGAHVFRLPGIYGPTRSAIDRVLEGKARRIDLPDQIFSRVHVDDIAAGVIAAINAGPTAPPGAYNLADDLPCPQNLVIEEACRLLGVPPPPLQTLAEAELSPAALAFYSENRRIANGKAKRVLGWRLQYPTYREGLRALIATTRPTIARAAPAAASSDQR